jgi:hypothetical protein
MTQPAPRFRAAKIYVLVWLLAVVSFAPALALTPGDKKDPEKIPDPDAELKAPRPPGGEDATPGRYFVRAGYTRPGQPETKYRNGKRVALAVWQQEFQGKIIGGTVYFAVFERVGTEGDSWGTGMANFDSTFANGRSFTDKFSPELDSRARYLYLYQVVNDRGLDPGKGGIALAGPEMDLRTEPLGSSVIRLLVDPRFITSWGHFRNSGFTLRVPNRTLKGDEAVPAAFGGAREMRLAVSGNPSILRELPAKKYNDRSPAYPLRQLRNSYQVDVSSLNLSKPASYLQLAGMKKKGGIKLAAWAENELEASDQGGKEPEFVQLL